MNLDDEICYCYHVSLRKLMRFSQRVRPNRPSQMTQCLGAGTGCGWCIPLLVKIAADPEAFRADDWTPEQYATSRKNYIRNQPRHQFDKQPYPKTEQDPPG